MSRIRRALVVVTISIVAATHGAGAAAGSSSVDGAAPSTGKGLSLCFYTLVGSQLQEQCVPLPRIYLPIPMPF